MISNGRGGCLYDYRLIEKIHPGMNNTPHFEKDGYMNHTYEVLRVVYFTSPISSHVVAFPSGDVLIRIIIYRLFHKSRHFPV